MHYSMLVLKIQNKGMVAAVKNTLAHPYRPEQIWSNLKVLSKTPCNNKGKDHLSIWILHAE